MNVNLIQKKEVIRDSDGHWSHPDIPDCDEDIQAWKSWLLAQGLETYHASLEDEGVDHPAYVAYFENGLGDVTEWTPAPPKGDNWFALSIHDTEDGPVWIWARRMDDALAATTNIDPTVVALKGVGKINGDGWKDTTKIGEVVFVWNNEKPRPYMRGQYPRIGNCAGWTASTDQYDFSPATTAEVDEFIDAYCASHQPAINVDVVMTMVQEFASTWSLVGGRFDNGTLMARSDKLKQAIRDMLTVDTMKADNEN